MYAAAAAKILNIDYSEYKVLINGNGYYDKIFRKSCFMPWIKDSHVAARQGWVIIKVNVKLLYWFGPINSFQFVKYKVKGHQMR